MAHDGARWCSRSRRSWRMIAYDASYTTSTCVHAPRKKTRRGPSETTPLRNSQGTPKQSQAIPRHLNITRAGEQVRTGIRFGHDHDGRHMCAFPWIRQMRKQTNRRANEPPPPVPSPLTSTSTSTLTPSTATVALSVQTAEVGS